MRRSLAGIIVMVALLIPGIAFAQRMIWIAVLVAYQAPHDAINWRGPWTRGVILAGENFYASEAECRTDTERRIVRIHQGMKAPILYRCVPFNESLP